VSHSDINATCADGSVPRAVASESPSISPIRKHRSLPLAVLTRMSSAQVALILFGLVEGIVQPDIMRFMRGIRIIQFI